VFIWLSLSYFPLDHWAFGVPLNGCAFGVRSNYCGLVFFLLSMVFFSFWLLYSFVPPNCHSLVFFLIVVVLCYVAFLVALVFYISWGFSTLFVLDAFNHYEATTLLLIDTFAHACCLTSCWNHVVHPKFMPMYLHRFVHKLAWSFYEIYHPSCS
jgi:hypothetical protein